MNPTRKQLIPKEESRTMYDELKIGEEIKRIEHDEIEHISITEINIYIYLKNGIEFKIRRMIMK